MPAEFLDELLRWPAPQRPAPLPSPGPVDDDPVLMVAHGVLLAAQAVCEADYERQAANWRRHRDALLDLRLAETGPDAGLATASETFRRCAVLMSAVGARSEQSGRVGEAVIRAAQEVAVICSDYDARLSESVAESYSNGVCERVGAAAVAAIGAAAADRLLDLLQTVLGLDESLAGISPEQWLQRHDLTPTPL